MSENVTTAPPVLPGVEWVRPRPGRRGYRNDLVLALVLAVGTAASVVLYRATGWGEGTPWWGAVLWTAGMTLPLAARRRWPEIVALVASAVFIVGAVVGVGEALFSNIALFVAIYTVGAWGRSRRVATVVRGAIVIVMFAWLFWGLIFFSTVQDHLPELSREGLLSPYLAYGFINVLTNLLYFGGAWYFGDTAYRSARARAELEQRTAELAAERERTRVQAVALERLRIARELHDVVAHHVSVIGVQAGAARRVLAKDPAAATASLSAIESNAREAVDELHGLLGTLRGDADTGPLALVDDAASTTGEATTSTSTRGIARIDELVRESADGGLPVTLAIVGEPRPVSPVVDLSAYRITQEALTNVRKHAGAAATAEVRVRWTDAALEIEITNSGTTTSVAGAARASEATGGGLGQLGMRERVAATGGTIELRPRARGGYLVRASFPLRRDETPVAALAGALATEEDA
ncbi:sensor histidine kinase [Agromyces lapidis]|uniref:histidine kinase n=1 Tax=Agromyces lapidis TaxID=279574 RepID=A0ABV5SKX3_9MICO|nr:histidine kinase [Agromyces lapidis]